MTDSVLFDHLELGERTSLEWRCSVKSDEVVVALAVKSFKLVADEAEHSERVKLLVDLL